MTSFPDKKRSSTMRSIHSKNTKPEKIVMNMLNELGVYYASHCSHFYGKPDFVCESYKAVIMVNGCFWHKHMCHMYRAPKVNNEYWDGKLEKNVERDCQTISELNSIGYKVLIVWECALMRKSKLDNDIVKNSIEEWLCEGIGNCEIDSLGIKTF
ncbi:TPA: DNA mismatch endonuclease Vsr [Citrobacter freundii]|nr:DNA mismatch endonuclease Vsr [Citrobacter freundii]